MLLYPIKLSLKASIVSVPYASIPIWMVYFENVCVELSIESRFVLTLLGERK